MTSQLSRTAPPAKHPKAGSSQVRRPFQARSDPASQRIAPPVRCLLRLMHVVIVRPLRAAAHRRELAQLSDRQLRDAGIDPALAGRGKAVAVDRSTLLRLLTLSQG
jgi:uncharacterized protein YjiS (DUF1127 family)